MCLLFACRNNVLTYFQCSKTPSLEANYLPSAYSLFSICDQRSVWRSSSSSSRLKWTGDGKVKMSWGSNHFFTRSSKLRDGSVRNSLAGLGFETDGVHVIICCEFFDQYVQVTLHKFAAYRLKHPGPVTYRQQLCLYNLAGGRKNKTPRPHCWALSSTTLCLLCTMLYLHSGVFSKGLLHPSYCPCACLAQEWELEEMWHTKIIKQYLHN